MIEFIRDLTWRIRVAFWHVWGSLTHTHIVNIDGGVPTLADPYGMKQVCVICYRTFGDVDIDRMLVGEPDPDGIGGRKALFGGSTEYPLNDDWTCNL